MEITKKKNNKKNKNKKPFLGLWLLIASAFVLILCLSMLKDVEVLGYSVKSSGMFDALTDTTKNNVDNALTAMPKAAPKKVECDTTSKNILFIGDSMLEGLSPRMAAYAKANGYTMHTIIWYSSTTKQWGKSDKLKDYIDKYKPNYIMICLGANELFVKDIKTERKPYITKMLNTIGNIPYVWIGPPNWKEDTGINDLINGSVKSGCYFVSKDLNFKRKKDGAHPTSESAIEWMDKVAVWMSSSQTNHPIAMKVPKEKTAKSPMVLLQPEYDD